MNTCEDALILVILMLTLIVSYAFFSIIKLKRRYIKMVHEYLLEIKKHEKIVTEIKDHRNELEKDILNIVKKIKLEIG